jgi:hypothetical protein
MLPSKNNGHGGILAGFWPACADGSAERRTQCRAAACIIFYFIGSSHFLRS